MTETKQVIVIRKDLQMRKGKMIAQGCHSSMKVLLDEMGPERKLKLTEDDPLNIWLNNAFAKIVVYVNSLEELMEVYHKAIAAGIRSALIQDHGRTEFHGEATFTCCAIGPDFPERIDPITGHLKLL